MTAQMTTTAGTKRKLPKAEQEKQLDEALQNTFPASDAVKAGVVTTNRPDRPVDRRPPDIDKALVDKLAREVADRKKGRS